MKILLAQPANIRFQWELEVCLTNIRSLDKEIPIVVLFLEESPFSPETVAFIRDKYPSVEVRSYSDDRLHGNYQPTVRPYLVWRYLLEDPSREKEDYFQIDSDVIFRQIPDFAKMPLDRKVCWTSDCDGYLGYDYLVTREQGDLIVERFSGLCGVSVDKIRKTPGGGAQWVIPEPTAQMWLEIWKDSETLYDFLSPLKSDIQKWTAEMWAELYALVRHGYEIRISPELSFCRPTEPIERWGETNILHNAGVTLDLSFELFFKGAYDRKAPFDEDLRFVDPERASREYAKAIKRVYRVVR